MTSILLTDKEYSERGKKIMQPKNSKVKIISDHDNVLIIENEKGHRFSVQKEHIKIIN